MTVSHWRRNATPRRIEREVVIVGAGICGVSAALHLQRRGVPYAVVERHTIGSGASQRNAGFLMRGAADNYAAAAGEHGRERARLLWRWTEENLVGLREAGIERLGSYRAVPSCLLALTPKELGELRASRAMLEEDGFRVGWIERGEDSIWRSNEAGAMAGLLNPGDASVNPYELMAMLAGKLSEPVIESQESCEIIRATAKDGGVVVRTSDALLNCRRVLVCTNAYGPLLLPQLSGLVTPRRGQVIALKAAGARLDYSYYAHHGSEYLRQTPDGTIVVGGCRTYHADREVGYDDVTTEYVQRDIEGFARRMLGADFEVTARWAGTMGFTPDGLPLIGPVPPGGGAVGDEWPQGSVWFCGGFTGHGMSMAHRTSRAAVEAMLDGAANPFPLSRFATGGPDAEVGESPGRPESSTVVRAGRSP